MATGAFAPRDASFYSRMIITTKPKISVPLVTPKAPLPAPSEPTIPLSRIPRMPVPPPTDTGGTTVPGAQPFTGGVITETTDNMGGGTSTGGATSTTSTGPTNTPTDASKLLDVLGSLFQETPVSAPMAPVSFASTDVGDGGGAAPAGGSKAGLLILAVVLVGGLIWYMRTRA